MGIRPTLPIRATITWSTCASGDHLLHRREGRAVKLGGANGGAPDVGGPELLHLLFEQFRVAARGQPDHLELIGEGADDVQRLPPDGAG